MPLRRLGSSQIIAAFFLPELQNWQRYSKVVEWTNKVPNIMHEYNNSHPAQKYIEQKVKNLEFFRISYPGIFSFFCNYSMRHSQLDVLSENGEIDLIINEQHLYAGKGTIYAKREVATFLSAYDYGSKIKSIGPLAKDAYFHRRLFATSVSKIYNAYYSQERQYDGYQLDNYFPLLVFMGVGIGRHIEILDSIRDIHHIVIFETDMDRFAASLFVVDWERIAKKRLDNSLSSIKFVLLDNPDENQNLTPYLWNQLLEFCPIFPLTTMFYNHLGNPVFDDVIQNINTDLYVHLFSFGNFDDELNQHNNALHNFRNKVPLLTVPEQEPSLPVCVVGSGPSLDSRIQDLKMLAKESVVVSCGTAIRALHSHGVIPDIHVELESDYQSYRLQALLDDPDYFNEISLIGAGQLNPLMFALFRDARVYFKDDGVLADWFGSKACCIPDAAPTCTNAALAMCFYMKFPEVFLFGLDFGFPNAREHHAKGTIYYATDKPGDLDNRYEEKVLIEVPGAAGGSISTTDFLYTSKRRIDDLLSKNNHARVFNCSDGAALENTRWLSGDEIAAHTTQSSEASKAVFLNCWFGSDTSILPDSEVTNVVSHIRDQINNFVTLVSKRVKRINSKSEFVHFCSFASAEMVKLKSSEKGLYYFLRGSIWHFILAGYSHLFTIQASEQQTYLRIWRDNFLFFLTYLPVQVEQVFHNEHSMENDDRVTKMIMEATASDIAIAVAEAEWDYEGYSIIDKVIHIDEIDFEYAGYCFKNGRFEACE